MALDRAPFRIFSLILQFVAILSTTYRLYRRWRTHQLWLDDLAASFALICSIPLLIVSFIPAGMLFRKDNKYFVARSVGQWSAIVGYIMVLWLARISIALATVRLLRPGSRMRSVSRGVVGLFLCLVSTLLIQKFALCASRPATIFRCRQSSSTAILELTFDLFADAYLIGMPLFVLSKMGLRSKEAKVLRLIFCASLLTSGSSVSHCYFMVRKNGPWTGRTAYLQASFSLIVCNFLVLGMALYRTFRSDSESEVSEESSSPISGNYRTTGSPPPPTEFTFTTVSSTMPASLERGSIQLASFGSSVGKKMELRSDVPSFPQPAAIA